MKQNDRSFITLNIVILAFVLAAMIGTAVYVSGAEKKRKYEQEEEYNNLNDYILLKA